MALRRISFVVFDKPEPWSRARVNTKTGRFYTEAKDQEARLFIRDAFMRAFPEWDESPLSGPIRLTVTAWLPMPKSLPKKYRATALPTKRPDLDNYIKQVEDALNHYAFLDDAQIVTIEARKRYATGNLAPSTEHGIPAGVPCWEVTLDEIES